MKYTFDKSFIPKLRSDLSIKIIQEDSNRYIILSDPKEYTPEKISLPLEISVFLQFLDGSKTMENIIESLKGFELNEKDINAYIDLIHYLDILGFLESPTYFALRDDWEKYYSSKVRPAICAGFSYPDDPDMLKKMFDAMDSLSDGYSPAKPATAIIAPHLDFRTGLDTMKAYALAYNSIKESDADTFIIFGTAHYRSSFNFMLSEKDFDTPIGVVETNRELINAMKSINSEIVYIDEQAHRFEHSIEFQVVLLKYFFNNRKFKILPVLVGSYYDYIQKNRLPSDDNNFKTFIETLQKAIDKLRIKPLYIASGDLAHIGRKFNDNFDANEKFNELNQADGIIIDKLKNCQIDDFFKFIIDNKDKWKVCGTAPFYALLSAVNPTRGYFLQYGIYDEKDTKSAVSFASLAFEK